MRGGRFRTPGGYADSPNLYETIQQTVYLLCVMLEENSVFPLQYAPIVHYPRSVGGRESCSAKSRNQNLRGALRIDPGKIQAGP